MWTVKERLERWIDGSEDEEDEDVRRAKIEEQEREFHGFVRENIVSYSNFKLQ